MKLYVFGLKATCCTVVELAFDIIYIDRHTSYHPTARGSTVLPALPRCQTCFLHNDVPAPLLGLTGR
jgi:hypothetical protein